MWFFVLVTAVLCSLGCHRAPYRVCWYVSLLWRAPGDSRTWRVQVKHPNMINKTEEVENVTSIICVFYQIKEFGLRQLDSLDFAGGRQLGWPQALILILILLSVCGFTTVSFAGNYGVFFSECSRASIKFFNTNSSCFDLKVPWADIFTFGLQSFILLKQKPFITYNNNWSANIF